jgi:hypothetical protein
MGGFAGGDNKTRKRGRAAPPGRCHSCNRAETPEWRRGPDGARTLCNACGLRKSFGQQPMLGLPTNILSRLRQVDSQNGWQASDDKLKFTTQVH